MAVITEKLCWNCEGTLDGGACKCSYCGVDLDDEVDERNSVETLESDKEQSKEVFLSDSSRLVSSPSLEDQLSISDREWQNSIRKELGNVTSGLDKGNNIKDIIIPLSLLLSGSVFLLFGFLVFLFSKDGQLNLSWNESYWFYYSFTSIPLLYFGWKALDELGVYDSDA